MAIFSAVTTSFSHAYIPKTAVSPTSHRRVIQCSTASVSTNFDLKTYWTALIKEIDQKLNDAVPVGYPERIYESMRYSLLAKGAKRAPPVMCVAACELFGGDRAAAFPTACALEMVHSASLIHDDLPCMDDAQSRRGQPSNHTTFGVDMAILAGDALFPLGFRHIVTHTPTGLVPEARLLQVITEIARAVGSTGMAAGQFVDLDNHGTTPNNAVVDFVQEKKFGEMGRCSAACGGILGGASDDEIQRLRNYGQAVGVLYQLVDDISEAKRDSRDEKTGKSYVSVYGVEKAMEAADDLRSQAKKELNGLEKYGEKVLPLYSFVDYAADRGFSVGDE
ncbi:heterodimeric geranylgeranyl pyrophosphate synthase small subunit chloroplastic [Phtheirospermum japonicum]|uniref:Heterodimeric geranylgeranyl pyrophosphate synthase small subunit chloroplastic n=1 Tax=Phtheirospermum japonicum TaxID=374723 RepID=A0A830DAB3_9LAMI|nr:heterodimeric geranylgeranyl pyrophosphate synthase small subunit chloroplastic [Phtheirospermum japonicum]